ncbi:MAG: barstar family protein [Burkholderiales bacterium]|nr:barstar family protein [Burkholderiales bacterium]
MAHATLDGSAITDWASFHAVSKQVFGFPDFYGNNMDAWVDCLSYLRDDEGMSKFRLMPDEVLEIDVTHAEQIKQRAPEILEELAFCVDAINDRYDDYGEKPALKLIIR